MERKGYLMHDCLFEWLKNYSETDMGTMRMIQGAGGHQLLNWKQLQKSMKWQPLNDPKIYG
jgi:hypothetical protein